MFINIVLFGEAGVGKSSIINLLAGQETAETSNGPRGYTLRSRQYTITLEGKTFNIWDTIGLGEPTFGVSNALGAIEEIYVLIQQIEQQGGLHLLLYCIPGARITQTTLNNYRLFFEVLCDRRIPIAVVVTRLESVEIMEDWWLRNKEHITKCGLEFSGHACVTGLLSHSKAAQSRAALESLLLGFDLGGNNWILSSEWVSGLFERLPTITGVETSSKVKHYKPKELEQLLHNRCMMDSVTAKQLARNLIRVLESSSSDSRSAPLPLRDRLVTSLRHFLNWDSTNWFKAILGSSFPIYDDDILVFVVGPSGSGKSTFVRAVTQAPSLVDVGSGFSSTRKVQAIRCELTDEATSALSANQRKYIVFVDTPSFVPEEQMNAVHEMSTWLKRTKSKSTSFGTIYLHRIEADPDLFRVQSQLDTFAGTFPPDLVTRAFPQRLHCVLSTWDHPKETTILHHRQKFLQQLGQLRPRVVNGQRLRWDASIYPNLFVHGDPHTAWEVVRALFPP